MATVRDKSPRAKQANAMAQVESYNQFKSKVGHLLKLDPTQIKG